MRAALLRKFDSLPDVTDQPLPEPGTGQVLVRVCAAALNPADILVMKNLLGPAVPELPAIPGMDVAGVVAKLGPDVTEFKVGDDVYGCVGGVKGHPGTFADYVVSDSALLARKPSGLTMREAASLPLVCITAWTGLVDRAKISPGEKVLIQGVTGGVSHAAIQIALARGAKVFATASSPEKAAHAKACGATPILYKDASVESYVGTWTNGDGFDVVYDTVGGDVFQQSAAATRLTGRLVTCAAWQPQDLSSVLGRSLDMTGIFMLLPLLTGKETAHHGDILREVALLVEDGRLKPHLDPARFTLDQIGSAYTYQASGKATGKIIIDVAV
ncbi:zinc-dependent alcohol dehydrogenase family protein [Acetobacter fallax]|uniref:Zinc-binding dehydrogenase n=1 Tax=Acetobacter fallax TaxID=1737473 RepID=A0ABX0KET0_9PROT|nr:zinc-dependent alcohol dehydrogenase family protein [Acetobacter fallax]NHO32447.1 zinc-binding dehydrogenase [Acetobacter fallax]NHO36007.1 zinc-binding dehydrogenase [Acetobacter fallax]